MSNVGAPTKYHDGIPSQLIKYFDRPLYEEIGETKVPSKFPTIEGFCARELKISKDTFYRWVKIHDELSDAFTKAKQLQKDHIIQMALIGAYKEGFAKFVAINCTDMVDKKEVEQSNPVPINISIKKDE